MEKILKRSNVVVKFIFAQDSKKSLEIINSYTANGLYEEIRTRLFQEKTFSYIDKVITLMHQYKRMGY